MQVTGNKVLTNVGLTIVHLVVPNLAQITLQTNLDIGPMQTMHAPFDKAVDTK